MGKKIIIVGGVAGGASFAARMRRLDEGAGIIMFERGKHVSFANCGLPYYIGGTIKQRQKLILQTPESFKERYNVEVRTNSEVTAVNPEHKRLTVRSDKSTYQESFDYLLLAPGCKPFVPPIPGLDHSRVFTLRNLQDMDKIKACASRPEVKRATVIGGGFIGLETAENLKELGLEVTLVELEKQIFLPADPEMANILHKHLVDKGVRLILRDGAECCSESSDICLAVSLKSGKSLKCEMVILAIGVQPDTGFLKDSGIQLNQCGAIVTDTSMKTNWDKIYAVGDAVEVTDFVTGQKTMIPLAGPANRQGRIAADNISGFNSTYKHTQGTAVCKLFELTAAVTGLNEKSAKRLRIPYLKSYTESASHASYYPGAQTLYIKLLFSPGSGQVLGAQVIGRGGADKRIDVLATAVRHKLSVFDLTELELAYAPPYGSAKDPVNMAGFAAENILMGRVNSFHVEDLEGLDTARHVLLDVRTPKETSKGILQGALSIPVDELRQRLPELDKNMEIWVYCQVGMRGYLAARILSQHGFTVKNLSGGYSLYCSCHYDVPF